MNWNKQTQEEIGVLLNVSLYPGSSIMKDVCCQFVSKKRALIQEGAIEANKVIFQSQDSAKYNEVRTRLLNDLIACFFPTPLKDGLSEDNINKLCSILQQFFLKVYNHVLGNKPKLPKLVKRV